MIKCTHLTSGSDGDALTLTCSIGLSMWCYCNLSVKCVGDDFPYGFSLIVTKTPCCTGQTDMFVSSVRPLMSHKVTSLTKCLATLVSLI